MSFAKYVAVGVSLCWLATPGGVEELSVGSKAPKLDKLEWVKGEAFELAKVRGRQVTVVEFWATWCAPCLESVPHLSKLQHRFADKNVRVVAVTEEDPGNTLDIVKKFVREQGDKMDYAVAFDKKGDVYRAWMTASGQSALPTAFVVNRDGVIAWIGHPMDDLTGVLSDVVDGTHDLELAGKLYQIDRRFESAMVDGNFEAMLAAAADGVKVQPQSVAQWMRKFTVLADFLGRSGKAKGCAREALKLAAGDPDRVARVAATIVTEDDAFGCNEMASEALQKSIRNNPKNADVRVAYFRVLVSRGEHQSALDLASEAIELMKGDAERLGAFAMMLSSPSACARFGDLAVRAIEFAIETQPEDPRHRLAKFQIMLDCKKDIEAANKAGHELVELACDEPELLNEFAWSLLTDESTKGRFRKLALAACEQMRKAEGGDGWSHLDTLALAEFENGRIDEAIAIQTEALEKCPKGPARYEVQLNLERYKRAKNQ
jgi:thiol-disulfide isomerase/thioredoxin/Flp pilus assembly protein TadD